MSASLLKRTDPCGTSGPRLDCAAAFRGLAIAAMPHLRRSDSGEGQSCVRDASEFLYALAHVLDRRWADSSEPLHRSPIAFEAISAGVSCARRHLHHASPQDIAKLAGAAAAAWTLMSQLRVSTLQPFISDLAQAVRFRHRDFNAKDVASIVVAFAKLDVMDDVVAEVLPEQVEARASEFPDKDLSLLLWACSRHGCMGRRCAEAAMKEFQRRDLSRMAVVDLCMASQALARLGPSAKAALCLAAGEAFNRQLHKFSTADKALFMWSLAKSRVVHLALCRLLIRHLAAECCGKLPRDIVSTTLWTTAVICPSLPAGDEWARKLVQDVCEAQPWVGASPFEVANACWAFGQVPLEWVSRFWPALVASAEKLKPGDLALHELCNLLSGLPLCPAGVRSSPQLSEQVLGEVVARVRNGARVSMHDKRSLRGMLSVRSKGDWPTLPGLEELDVLVNGQPSGAPAGAAPPEASAWVAVPVLVSVAPAPQQEADQAAGCTPRPQQPASAGAGAAHGAQSTGGGEGQQQDHRKAVEGHGPASRPAAANPQRVRAKSPVWRVPPEGCPYEHPPRECPEGCPWLDDEGMEDLRSPDLTPRRHYHEADSARMTCRNVTCCPSVDGSDLVVGDSAMQVNSHCDFPGHCVQLRNTFISSAPPRTRTASSVACVAASGPAPPTPSWPPPRRASRQRTGRGPTPTARLPMAPAPPRRPRRRRRALRRPPRGPGAARAPAAARARAPRAVAARAAAAPAAAARWRGSEALPRSGGTEGGGQALKGSQTPSRHYGGGFLLRKFRFRQ
ncbi:unnamed protein product, partial [Prorocentrum cordatum]